MTQQSSVTIKSCPFEATFWTYVNNTFDDAGVDIQNLSDKDLFSRADEAANLFVVQQTG